MELCHKAQRSGKLLTFLRRELELSSSLVKRLKWQQALLVNGAVVKTDHFVQPGDEITVRLDEEIPEFPPQDGALEILYEDEALLALDKPAGLLMHPSFYRNADTLANYVLGYYVRTGQSCAVHPVSRLDRDTFGVVLLAKNAHIHAKMMEALQQGLLRKTYEALVWQGPAEDSGVWEFPIARRGGESLLREVRPDGQRARTEYQVLQRTEHWSRLRLNPVTGRTHQLRVHCSHVGCPILGDPQYGSEDSLALSRDCGLSYQQLWAASLELPHPVTGECLRLRSRQALAVLPSSPRQNCLASMASMGNRIIPGTPKK